MKVLIALIAALKIVIMFPAVMKEAREFKKRTIEIEKKIRRPLTESEEDDIGFSIANRSRRKREEPV